jgi:hypothetical protein
MDLCCLVLSCMCTHVCECVSFVMRICILCVCVIRFISLFAHVCVSVLFHHAHLRVFGFNFLSWLFSCVCMHFSFIMPVCTRVCTFEFHHACFFVCALSFIMPSRMRVQAFHFHHSCLHVWCVRVSIIMLVFTDVCSFLSSLWSARMCAGFSFVMLVCTRICVFYHAFLYVCVHILGPSCSISRVCKCLSLIMLVFANVCVFTFIVCTRLLCLCLLFACAGLHVCMLVSVLRFFACSCVLVF